MGDFSQKNVKIWVLAVVAVFVIVLFTGTYLWLTGSPTTSAFLYVESGVVEVDDGSGWQPADNEMSLQEEDKVRTLDGSATIVFYESELMTLGPNTEVSINTLLRSEISLSQKAGETWNRINKLTGRRTYTIDTPHGVATVRGTGFNIKASGEIMVSDGNVHVVSKESRENRDISGGSKVDVDPDGVHDTDWASSDSALIIKKVEKDIVMLKKLRVREMEKKKFIIKRVQKSYGVGDSETTEFLDMIDRGEISLHEVKENIPVDITSLQKIADITEQIVALTELVEKMKRDA